MSEDFKILTTEERIHAWVDEPGTGEWNLRPQEMSRLWDLVWGDDYWWLHWEAEDYIQFWRPVYQHITRYSVDTYPLTVHFNLRLVMDWYKSSGESFNDGTARYQFAPLSVARSVPRDKDWPKTTTLAYVLREVETLVGTITKATISPLEEGRPVEVLRPG